MPGGAPPPMQMSPLQFLKPQDGSGGSGIGKAIGGLADQYGPAKQAIQNFMNPQAGPNEAVGTPGSQYQGPVAPGTPVPGAPAQAPMPQAPPPQPPAVSPAASLAANPGQPDPNLVAWAQKAPPPVLLDWLKRTAGGQPMLPTAPMGGIPGTNIGQQPGLGMLPSSGGFGG